MTLNAKAANLSGASASFSILLSAQVHLYPKQCNRVFFSVIFLQDLFFYQRMHSADSIYLGLHKLRVVLVDLHLFDLLLSVLCVQ